MPLEIEENFSYDETIPLSTFFQQHTIGGCYGTHFNEVSVYDARRNEDLCLLKLDSVENCAPGWDKEIFIDSAYCVEFQRCSADFATAKSAFIDLPADENVDDNQNIVSFQFRPGWKNIEGAEAMLVSKNRSDIQRLLRIDGSVFLAVNSVFLAAGGIGLILIVIGLIASRGNGAFAAASAGITHSGFLQAIPGFAVIGKVVLFVGSLGFLIYNAAMLAKLNNQLPQIRADWAVPGAGKVLSDCSLVLIILNSFILVLIICNGVLVMFDLKLSKNADIGLQLVIAILFIGPLIAASIGISVSSAIVNPAESIEWYHSSNTNRSTSVASYVNNATAWENEHSPGELFCESRPGPTVWDVCGCSDEWFDNLKTSAVGTYDRLSKFDYAFYRRGTNPPWGYSKSFKWDDPPGWNDLYSSGSTVGCYGTVFDNQSIDNARNSQDLCRLSLRTIEDCAPGWTRSLFIDIFCTNFQKCKADFEINTGKWEKFDGMNVSQPNESQSFQLPRGWNSVDKLEEYLKSQSLTDLHLELLTQPKSWFVFNTSLFAMAVIGWIFIIVGIIAGVLNLGGSVIPDPLRVSLVPQGSYE
jgi:hypothetical protein